MKTIKKDSNATIAINHSLNKAAWIFTCVISTLINGRRNKKPRKTERKPDYMFVMFAKRTSIQSKSSRIIDSDPILSNSEWKLWLLLILLNVKSVIEGTRQLRLSENTNGDTISSRKSKKRKIKSLNSFLKLPLTKNRLKIESAPENSLKKLNSDSSKRRPKSLKLGLPLKSSSEPRWRRRKKMMLSSRSKRCKRSEERLTPRRDKPN